MNAIINNLKFFQHAIYTNLKLSLSLRAAFLITLVLTVLKQLLFLVAWNFFFQKYQQVRGWDFNLMLAMYGLVCFSMGVAEGFFYGLKDFPKMIDNGQLDTFLLQPKNLVLNIAISKGDVASFGEIIAGLLFIGSSGYALKAFPIIIVLLLLSALFMFSLLLYIGCIAFFFKNSFDFIRELNLNAVIVATQPNVAYKGALKMLTFTILPVGILSFLPVEYLRTGLWEYLALAVLGVIVFFGVACFVFKMGLRRYESGNKIIFRQ